MTHLPTVLVVDDVTDAAETLAVLLKFHGFDVRTAPNGPAALAATAADRPDVVLTDLAMPQMTGWDLATRLRDLYPDRPPEVVAVSGRQTEEDLRRSAAAGIRTHFLKPADPAELIEYLRTLASPPGRQPADGGH